MRGSDDTQEALFSFSKLEDFVPSDHPLRPIREIVNVALRDMNELFSSIYKAGGRASIPPEKLIRALLLQVFFSVRSERQLMEQIRDNTLFRCFAGSSAWRSMIPSGTTPASPRTATGCWTTMSLAGSSPRSWRRPIALACCRRNISRLTVP